MTQTSNPLIIAALALGLALLPGAALQAESLPQPGSETPQTAKAETVRLLVGLGEIEAMLQLGVLLADEAGAQAARDSFDRALTAEWPALRDGVLQAGGPDLEPALARLASGESAAFPEALMGLAKARTALNPAATDLVAAMLAQGKSVAAGLNPAGPTDVTGYRAAWSGLMVLRGKVDLLLRDPDPSVVQAATATALALDDLILSLPDPKALAPVMLDPAQVAAALKPLEAVAGAA
jgi:hypothetical protein